MKDGGGVRTSLFNYYSGKSSLATWLRAVLAQRYVDRLRAQRRAEPLPDEDVAGRSEDHDPDRARYAALVRRALERAVGGLPPRDRLRFGCYYVQELTLAETGRAMKESEATSSRQLARTRLAIRREVERELRDEAGLNPDQIAACFASVAEDPGPLDLKKVIYE
jgi:RNA polymerase sigma-70 factor (ECF subfamily)